MTAGNGRRRGYPVKAGEERPSFGDDYVKGPFLSSAPFAEGSLPSALRRNAADGAESMAISYSWPLKFELFSFFPLVF